MAVWPVAAARSQSCYRRPSRRRAWCSASRTPRSPGSPGIRSSRTRRMRSRSSTDRATRSCSASNATRSASAVSSKPRASKSSASAATFSSRTETPAILRGRRYPAMRGHKRVVSAASPRRSDVEPGQIRRPQGERKADAKSPSGPAAFAFAIRTGAPPAPPSGSRTWVSWRRAATLHAARTQIRPRLGAPRRQPHDRSARRARSAARRN